MAKIISGMVNTNGEASEGSRFTASPHPAPNWAVAVTYKQAFERVPVALVSVSGSVPRPVCSVQSSASSLVIYTDSEEPVALFFLATDRGLGA